MKKIKVLQVVWRFNTGGAERMVISFHNHFSKSEEVDIRTLCFTPSKHELWENELASDGSVVYIPEFWADKMSGVIKKIGNRVLKSNYRTNWFLKQVELFQPDIIHIHLANMASELYSACSLLHKNIKVYYHLHSMPEAVPNKFFPNIIKGFKTGVYHPICVTDLQRKSAHKVYGISLDSPIVYNGIDERKFIDLNMSENERKILLASLGIKQHEFVIGCVGRGAPVKNYELLAKVAASHSKIQPSCLLVIGEIPEDLRNTMRSNIGDAHIVFAGQRKDTNKMYRLMNVFVLTSFYESSSIVTVESQLSGTPCVVSSSISDEVIISDSVMKVSPYGSPEEWCKKIQELQGKTVILKDEERFDFYHSVDTLLNIYKDVYYDKNKK